MPTIEDLIEAVNSVEFQDAVERIYDTLYESFNLKDYDVDTFTSFFKAYYIIEFKKADTRQEKTKLINEAATGGVYSEDAYWLFDTLTTSNATIGQVIDEELVMYLRYLNKYLKDLRYEDLTKRDEKIKQIVKEINGYFTIEEIKNGNYTAQYGYKLNKKEIKSIEYTQMTACLNKLIHNLYDERNILGDNRCLYDEIEEDNVLKRFDFHTDRINPEFEILFDDDSIIRYYKGDIKVRPYKLDDIIKYIKLYIIESYEKLGDRQKELIQIKDFDDELLKETVCMVFFRVYTDLNDLEDVYTKKMIDASKKELEAVKQLCKKYNL